MSDKKSKVANLILPNGNKFELPIHSGTIGPDVIEIKKLYADTDHFTYDPNVLTIQYFIPPVYSFPSRTEVYDKINDDFDNIADIIPNFSPVCSNSGQLSLQHRLGLIDTP